ncbi:MAG TPA: NRDE family protein, partial [bacterium]|nr:NRDE family protein [bacterium]
NYRKLPQDEDRRYKSRGQLLKNYLTGHQNAFAYLFDVSQQYKEYKPFNLLLGEEDSLYYFCSEQREISEITSPGIYGLSNHLLDTPWPKVEQGKRELEKAVFRDRFDLEDLFAILANQDEVEEEQLPETGLDWRWERALAKVFVSHENYATVSSTVILWGWDNHIELIERTYRSGVDDYQDKAFAFQVA